MRDVSVKSAARILDVLELLALLPGGIRVNELARQLDIPKSSASSLLATLEQRGYAEATSDGFRLSERLRDGWVGGDGARLAQLAKPAMQRLVARTGESAFLGVAAPQGAMRYAQKVVSDHPLRYDVELGTVRPGWCTSIGHVLLAAWDDAALHEHLNRTRLVPLTPRTVTDPARIEAAIRRVRRQGFAPAADSHVLGAAGVAAPVHDARGRTIAGLAVIAPSARFEPRREAITDAVVEVAAELSRALDAPATAAAPAAAPAPASRARPAATLRPSPR